MELEKLSKEAEREIVGSLEEAITLTNSGVTPNSAIQKVAEDRHFAPEIVKRMVEAYNTSRTLAHLKSASVESRGASFPLADAKVILDAMYPEKVTVPAVKAASMETPISYDRPESREFFKAARWIQIKPILDRVTAYGQDPNIIAQKILEKKASWGKSLDSARSEYRQTIWKVSELIKESAEYFGRLNRTPFLEVERNMVGEFGEVAKPLMEILYKQAALKEARYSGPLRQWSFDLREEPYPTLVKAIEFAKEASVKAKDLFGLEEQHEKLLKEANGLRPQFNEPANGLLTDVLVESVGPPFEYNPLLPREKKEAEAPVMGGPSSFPFDKSGFLEGVTGAAEDAVMGSLGLSEPDSEKIKAKALSESMDPIHESKLNEVTVRTMLNDFIANDPIISGYDPEQVTQAFNQLSQLSPQVAQQPAVARTMIRRMLQSDNVVEPHEATSLSELNRSLQQQGMMIPQLIPGYGPPGGFKGKS